MNYNDPTTKPTNPKDALGSNKLPLHLVPPIAVAQEALALEYGMLQYGRANWRGVGVRATIYIDAVFRHMYAYLEGEDRDPDSGLSHLAHARACLAILLDAENLRNLTDDRQFPGNYRNGVDALTHEVGRLKKVVAAMGKDAPHHYTIQDVLNAVPTPPDTGALYATPMASCDVSTPQKHAIPFDQPMRYLSQRTDRLERSLGNIEQAVAAIITHLQGPTQEPTGPREGA